MFIVSCTKLSHPTTKRKRFEHFELRIDNAKCPISLCLSHDLGEGIYVLNCSVTSFGDGFIQAINLCTSMKVSEDTL
jgi:hypothetical protein